MSCAKQTSVRAPAFDKQFGTPFVVAEQRWVVARTTTTTMATSLLNPYVGGGQDSVGGGGGGGPVGAVTASNPQKGVKRGILGNPVGVPKQMPGFRGRAIDPTGPIKAPKLRNGNLNNETTNVRVPYSRVAPLEFLSSYTGRLSPGDVVFVHKYPPGFVQSRPQAVNATLGVNTMTRVVGLDGLNRLLMGSNPAGWQVGLNVMWLNDKRPLKDSTGKPMKDAMGRDKVPPNTSPVNVTKGGNTAEFALKVLNEYRLDGIIISNDEPGSFTSSGTRDNVLLNVAIQGPTECNNGFLMYEPQQNTSDLYNPLTGVTNPRTVESYARGSAESGAHIASSQMPGRVGSPWLPSGKTDFVANFCGTYSMYPAQMFDRRVETMNSLYLGLRAYELSTPAKLQVKDENGKLLFENNEARADSQRMVFFQYMPFSSRVAAVIGQVTDQHEKDKVKDPQSSRAAAAKKVGSTKRRSSISDYNTPFDQCTYDPIRTEDLRNMVGAWHVGRVLDTKASRHDPYAGGPRDTAFSCIVDVGLSWRSAKKAEKGYPGSPASKNRDPYGATRSEKLQQQTSVDLTNHAQPELGGKDGVLGEDFGLMVMEGLLCNQDEAQAASKRAEVVRAVVKQRGEEKDEATRVTAEKNEARKVKELKKAMATKENKEKLNALLQKYGVPNDEPPMKKVRDYLLELAGLTFDELSEEDKQRAQKTLNAFNNLLGAVKDSAFNAAFKAVAQAPEDEINALGLVDKLSIDQLKYMLSTWAAKLNAEVAGKREGWSNDYGKNGTGDPLMSKVGNLIEARAITYANALRALGARLAQKKGDNSGSYDYNNAMRAAAQEGEPWEEDLMEHIHAIEITAILASGHEHVGCCLLPIEENAASKAPAPTGAKPRGRSKTPPTEKRKKMQRRRQCATSTRSSRRS